MRSRLLEALVAGLLGAFFVAGWVAALRVGPYPLGTSDFQDYCTAVAAYRTGHWQHWPSQRSLFAGWLPGALAVEFGVLRGLVYGSLLSTVGWIGATWLWTWALAGRRAAWLAVVWVGAFGPLVLLTRTVSFYPEVALVHTLAAACVAGSLARAHWGWAVASAVTVALVPLADVRSVLVLCALAPAAWLGAVATRAPWWARGGLLGLHGAALWAAWRWGALAYPSALVATLQSTVFRYAEDAARLSGQAWALPAWEHSPAFAWSKTELTTLPDAIRYLRAVDASRPAELGRLALMTANGREIAAWAGPLGVAATLAVGALARRPRALLALLATTPAFLILLRSAALTLPHPRQLALGSASLPVLFGVGSAAVLFLGDALHRRAATRWPAVGRVWRGVPAALLVVAVGAWILTTAARGGRGSALGTRLVVEGEPAESLQRARTGDLRDVRATCARILSQDAARGHPLVLPVFAEPAVAEPLPLPPQPEAPVSPTSPAGAPLPAARR